MADSIWKRLGRWLDDSLGARSDSAVSAGPPAQASDGQPLYERTPRKVVAFQWERPDTLAQCAMLHVDEVGAHRLLLGTRFLISSREMAADVALAGVNHAAGIALRTSLQGGAAWVLCPISSEPIFVDDAPVAGPTVLADGDRVRFGSAVELLVSAPDPASAACVLELTAGDASVDVTRTVLLPPGVTGRIQLGRSARAHVQTPALQEPLLMVHRAGELVFQSDTALTLAGKDAGHELALAFPPEKLQVITVGPARGARPPFEITIAPAPPPLETTIAQAITVAGTSTGTSS